MLRSTEKTSLFGRYFLSISSNWSWLTRFDTIKILYQLFEGIAISRQHHRLNTLQKISDYFRNELPQASSKKAVELDELHSYTTELLSLLGNPERASGVIHVGGTSGKGTVSYLIEAMLRAHDQRTMLSVSPHVYDIRERIQSNGQPLPEKLYIQIVNSVLQRAHELAQLGKPQQYHGILAAITMLGFTSKRHDYTIIESSIGGPHDLTNLINDPKKFCVLANISPDNDSESGVKTLAQMHTALLHNQSPLVMLEQTPKIQQEIRKLLPGLSIQPTIIPRSHAYELDDLQLALTVVQQLSVRDGWSFNEEVARAAASSVYMPARYEKRLLKNTLVILDGAHNHSSLSALADRLERNNLEKVTTVFSLGIRKDAEACLQAIAPITEKLVVTEYFRGHKYPSRQAIEPHIIADAAKRLGYKNIEIEPSPTRAVEHAVRDQRPVLVTGSFYLASEIDHIF